MQALILNRHYQYYKVVGIPVVSEGGAWRLYKRMLVPIGPVKSCYDISQDTAIGFIRETGALFLYATKGLEEGLIMPDTKWYSVICDRFRNLDDMDAKNRSEIKSGLKNCRVRKVSAEEIAENGFDVLTAAFRRYRGVKLTVSRNDFRQQILRAAAFSDIIDFFGVYCGERLVGYSQNFLYDRIEVNYSTVKLHPDFLKHHSAYALFYEMNKYYLLDHGFEYVNVGFRRILHETNIQDFLIAKLGFRRVRCPLVLHLRPEVEFFLKVSHPFRSFLGKFHPCLAAFFMLNEAAESCC